LVPLQVFISHGRESDLVDIDAVYFHETSDGLRRLPGFGKAGSGEGVS